MTLNYRNLLVYKHFSFLSFDFSFSHKLRFYSHVSRFNNHNKTRKPNSYLLSLRNECTSLPRIYISLSKIRLSLLVVATSSAGYLIAPGPATFSITQFTATTVGTFLCAGAANTLNQILEIHYDSLMTRTCKRVLVKGLITPKHALFFAGACSVSGISLLYFGVNLIAALFGTFNIMLYAFVYTPMKRYSLYNNWLGAIVGAIPPLLGWSAATGRLSTNMLILGALLFAWQFPHTASLGHYRRNDYSNANYKMMSVVDPQMNFRVGFRYSILLTPISITAPIMGVTNYWFIADSLLLNLAMAWFGWKFYNKQDNKSSYILFRYTLIYLPLLLMLMVVNKKVIPGENYIQTMSNNNSINNFDLETDLKN